MLVTWSCTRKYCVVKLTHKFDVKYSTFNRLEMYKNYLFIIAQNTTLYMTTVK